MILNSQFPFKGEKAVWRDGPAGIIDGPGFLFKRELNYSLVHPRWEGSKCWVRRGEGKSEVCSQVWRAWSESSLWRSRDPPPPFALLTVQGRHLSSSLLDSASPFAQGTPGFWSQAQTLSSETCSTTVLPPSQRPGGPIPSHPAAFTRALAPPFTLCYICPAHIPRPAHIGGVL